MEDQTLPTTPRDERESRRRVSRVITALLREQPFFGSLALRLDVISDPSKETIAADGEKFYYSPLWVKNAKTDVLRIAIARLVLACALKHHLRRGERKMETWQSASRLSTVEILRQSDFYIPSDIEGRDDSVERIYENLMEGKQDSSDAPEGENDEQESNEGAEDDGQGDGGSNDPDGLGEIMDAPSSKASAGDGGGDGDTKTDNLPQMTQTERDKQEREWDSAMQQAQSLSKAAGKESAGITRKMEHMFRFKEDPLILFKQFMRSTSKSDYSWSMPNRRHIDEGLYLPSIYSEGMGHIVIAIDSSGSIDEKVFNQSWSATRQICLELKPERVHVLFCSTMVENYFEYSFDCLPTKLDVSGGGGTRFTPVFKWVAEKRFTPDVLVYFTDLFCDDYPTPSPRDYPTVWMNWEAPNKDNRPPFGQVIDLV